MEKNMAEIKIALVGGVSTVCSILGWQGVMALIWVLAMLTDYISGTAAACRRREWDSSVARQGLWHKGGMILVVVVAIIADIALGLACEHLPLSFEWHGLVLPLVLAWYIITELGSILENAVKLGAVVPSWLTKLLKTSLRAVDDAADLPGDPDE